MTDALKNKVDTLVKKLKGFGRSSTHTAEAIELIELIPELFGKIEHGESGHREWLNEAIVAHFTKGRMPEYKAK